MSIMSCIYSRLEEVTASQATQVHSNNRVYMVLHGQNFVTIVYSIWKVHISEQVWFVFARNKNFS